VAAVPEEIDERLPNLVRGHRSSLKFTVES